MDLIVVEDPKGEYYEGSLVTEQRAAQLRARGVAMLPVDPQLFKLSGAGGYFKRSWGAGWPLDTPYPVMAAKMILYCDQTHLQLHWLARLAPQEDGKNLGAAHGALRLAADTGQRANNMKLTPVGMPVDVRLLGEPDERGGWTVGGLSRIATPGDGHYGLALYGNAPGLTLLWAAVTNTK
jgi:hypothetical protein